jgi:cytochrome c oxidase assembly protein subunit 15
LAVLAWRPAREPGQPVALPLALLGVMVFQALLGMWTVTWQLKPVVVMAHLLGGLTTLSLLAWLVLRQGHYGISDPLLLASGRCGVLPCWDWLLLVGQIALGGWTSANYAALACPDFPTCQAHGGRRWIFGRRSPYGEGWGFPTKAVCWAMMPE